MCIVSDTSLEKLLFREQEFEQAKEMFENGRWNAIGDKILIYPLNLGNMGPFSYDLCAGHEAFNPRTQQTKSLATKEGLEIEPGDVALVLTHEYVGLPRSVAGSVLPRFSIVREGVFQSMTKIDPTWFGNIAVALVNHSPKPFVLRKGQPFCTLVFQKLDKPCSRIRSLENTPALGRKAIKYFLHRNKKQQKPRSCLR